MGEMYCQCASRLFNEHKVFSSVNTITKTADILQQVGPFLQEAGNYTQAKSVPEQFLMTSQSIQYQEGIATAFNMLGDISYKMGKYEKARGMFDNALSTCLKLFGEHHHDVATTFSSLGILCDQGKYGEAMEMYEKALSTHLKLFGQHHPEVATSFNNLGNILYDQEKHEEAREMLEKAFYTHLKLFGEYHPDVASSFNNLGMFFISRASMKKQGRCMRELFPFA
jgi:tetratricopeptide (TPR) repeat protein